MRQFILFMLLSTTTHAFTVPSSFVRTNNQRSSIRRRERVVVLGVGENNDSADATPSSTSTSDVLKARKERQQQQQQQKIEKIDEVEQPLPTTPPPSISPPSSSSSSSSSSSDKTALDLPSITDSVTRKKKKKKRNKAQQQQQQQSKTTTASSPPPSTTTVEKVDRSNISKFNALLELDPSADMDDSNFNDNEYNVIDALLGEGAEKFLGIPLAPLQIGYVSRASEAVRTKTFEHPVGAPWDPSNTRRGNHNVNESDERRQ